MKKLTGFLLIAFALTQVTGFCSNNPFNLDEEYQIQQQATPADNSIDNENQKNAISDNKQEPQHKLAPMTDKMISFSDLTDICYESYAREGIPSQLPENYEKISFVQDEESGFQALSCLDKKTGKMVVCFTGTQPMDGVGDLVADLGIVVTGLNHLKKLILKKNRFEDKIKTAAKKIAELEKDGKKLKATWFKSKKKLFELYLRRISNKIGKERKKEVKRLEKSQGSQNQTLSRQVKLARQFLKDSKEKYKKMKPADKESNVVLTGHSLGGFLAQIVGTETGLTTFTFNAPGAQGYLPELKNSKNVYNYIRESDLVGNFGQHIGKVEVISDLDGNKISPSYLYKNHDIEGFAGQY